MGVGLCSGSIASAQPALRRTISKSQQAPVPVVATSPAQPQRSADLATAWKAVRKSDEKVTLASHSVSAAATSPVENSRLKWRARRPAETEAAAVAAEPATLAPPTSARPLAATAVRRDVLRTAGVSSAPALRRPAALAQAARPTPKPAVKAPAASAAPADADDAPMADDPTGATLDETPAKTDTADTPPADSTAPSDSRDAAEPTTPATEPPAETTPPDSTLEEEMKSLEPGRKPAGIDDEPPARSPLDEPMPADEPPSKDEFAKPAVVGCDEAHQRCEKDLANLKAATLDKLSIDIALSGVEGKDFPCVCTLASEPFEGRHWCETLYTWKASALCHKPLYFEDVQLERYGHSWCPWVQPFVSGAHFFGSVPLLPYRMGTYPPNECIYALGHYRPGNCAPYLVEPPTLSPRGGLLEAAVAVGMVFVIP